MACKICGLLEKAALVAGGWSSLGSDWGICYIYIYISAKPGSYLLQSPADQKTPALTLEDSEKQGIWLSLQFQNSNFSLCMGWCDVILHQPTKSSHVFSFHSFFCDNMRSSTFQLFTSIVTRGTARMPWPLVKLVKSWMLLDVVERNQVHHRFWRIQRTRRKLNKGQGKRWVQSWLIEHNISICTFYSGIIYICILLCIHYHVFIHVMYIFTICMLCSLYI